MSLSDEIAASVRGGLEGADVSVELDGNRALITVVSAAFAPMNRVQKQQAVYACIGDFLADGRLHAVTIRALTPDET